LFAAIIGLFTYRAHQREGLQLFTPVETPMAIAVDGWDLPPPETSAAPLETAPPAPSAASATPDAAKQEALGKLRSVVTRCGRAEHAAGRKLEPGLLTLKVQVVEGGRIGGAAFLGDVKRSPEFEACVAEGLKTVTVPAAFVGIHLSLELNLR
jgi:hypothetical protein